MHETLVKTYVEWRACSNPRVKKGVASFSFPLVSMLSLWAKREKKRYIRLHILFFQSRTNWPFFLACSKTVVCCPPKSTTPSLPLTILFHPNSTDKILFDPNSLPPKSYYIIKKFKKPLFSAFSLHHTLLQL